MSNPTLALAIRQALDFAAKALIACVSFNLTCSICNDSLTPSPIPAILEMLEKANSPLAVMVELDPAGNRADQQEISMRSSDMDFEHKESAHDCST